MIVMGLFPLLREGVLKLQLPGMIALSVKSLFKSVRMTIDPGCEAEVELWMPILLELIVHPDLTSPELEKARKNCFKVIARLVKHCSSESISAWQQSFITRLR